MIALHPTADALLRRLVDAGSDGLPLDPATVPPGDCAALVIDDLAEITAGCLIVTELGRAFALRTVMA